MLGKDTGSEGEWRFDAERMPIQPALEGLYTAGYGVSDGHSVGEDEHDDGVGDSDGVGDDVNDDVGVDDVEGEQTILRIALLLASPT